MMHHRPILIMMMAASGLMASCRPAPSPTATPATPAEIDQRIRQSRAPLTLVHVWATWCDPCREEFPELVKVYRNYRDRGVALLLVSADDSSDVKKVDAFLREQKSPVGSLVSTDLGQDFINMLSPKWSGALPASFFFDSSGKLEDEWEGKHSFQDYSETIERLLKTQKGATP